MLGEMGKIHILEHMKNRKNVRWDAWIGLTKAPDYYSYGVYSERDDKGEASESFDGHNKNEYLAKDE